MFGFFKTKNINKGYKEFLKDENAILLDVRTVEEYNEGHLKHSINIPLGEIKFNKLDKNKKIYVYCRSGSRSQSACFELTDKGFEAIDIGGIMWYKGELE